MEEEQLPLKRDAASGSGGAAVTDKSVGGESG